MYDNLRVISLVNRQDIIADFTEFVGADNEIQIGENVFVPRMFELTKPHIIMMHQTSSGINVGLAPMIHEDSDITKVSFQASQVVSSYALGKNSGLAKAYVKAVSPIDLSPSMPSDWKPLAPKTYRAG